MIDLSGKTAVVTGGSRGVGRATAMLLGQAGCAVAIGYHSREADAQRVVDQLESLGAGACAVRGDLSEPDASVRLFDTAEDTLGGVDFFIGNHGVWPVEDVPLAEMDASRWHHTLTVNLNGIFFSTREAAKRIRDHGRIVLVSSTAGQRGEAYHGDYAASKGAIISLVKGLCVELGPRDVTVNAVAPGWIETEMAAPAMADGGRESIAAGIPIGRVATAEDVAGPILFLCTPLARHITGEILNVNGGAVLPG